MATENLPLVVANQESKVATIGAAVNDALNSRAPNDSQMQPGRVYVGRLPGHSGPVFVRRRRKSFFNPLGVPAITSIVAPPMDYQYTSNAIYQPPQPTYVQPAQIVQPTQLLPPAPAAPLHTAVTTTTTHHEHPEKCPVPHSAGSVSSNIPQVRNLTKLNGHDGGEESKSLADGVVIDLTHLMNGAAHRARKNGATVTGTGPLLELLGNGDLQGRALESARGYTSTSHRKKDIGPGALQKTFASFAV
ncbi:MAG: hypothetical protein Q9222_006831 [Ikaeria aurantiellina]